jgi:predicted DNA-binding transcriptional regulator YafY
LSYKGASVTQVNRTDRLYAIVEQLRAVSPRPRSTRWLAGHFEVSTRTIERDVSALQQTGVPIYAEAGRLGGYVLDRSASLPPLNIAPAEAVAIAVALRQLGGTPFTDPARTALAKVVAVMSEPDAQRAERLAQRVHLVQPAAPVERPAGTATALVRTVLDALTAGHVLEVDYADRHAVPTRRYVEPMGFLGGPRGWYLLGWCRLRADGRVFRLDRMKAVRDTGEVAPPREIDPATLDFPEKVGSRVTVR